MRELTRIDKICKLLAQLWKEYPDERFGQFIMNHIFNEGKDPFFREDVKEKWIDDTWMTWEKKINTELKQVKEWKKKRGL